jgi:hypothetical protein
MNQHSGFKTIQRPIVLKDIETFANNDLTPTVVGGNLFLTATGHTSAKSITMLDGGLEGQVVTVQGANNTYKTTIVKGTNMNLQSNWVEEANSTITLMFDGTGWYEISRNPINASNVNLGVVGTPTYSDLDDLLNLQMSSGRLTGGVITAHSPANGSVDISAMEGMIKITNAVGGAIKFFTSTVQTVALTDEDLNYLYMDYDGGNLTIKATVDRTTIHDYDHFTIGRAYRSGTSVDIVSSGTNIYNEYRRIHNRMVKKYGFDWASGSTLSESDTRKLAITAGVWFVGNTEIDTAALDTNVTGSFSTYYVTAGTWTKTTGVTQLGNTQYNDIATGLTALGVAKYANYWVYQCPAGDLYVLYGQAQYNSLSEAIATSSPATVPNYINDNTRLVARITFRQAATNFSQVTNAHTTTIPSAAVSLHNNLGNLAWGSSGHTGTATNVAGFDGTGAASFCTLSGTGTQIALTTSPVFVTPVLGTPASGTLTNCTFPTLNQNTTGSAGSLKSPATTGLATLTGMTAGQTRNYTVPDSNATLLYSGGALGTPASGVVTNLTGTASININGTVGATTPTTGVFTTINTLTIGKGNNSLAMNTALGYLALSGANTGTGQNTAVGYAVLADNTSGAYNTACGAGALDSNTEGNLNSAFGLTALYSNLTGDNNTALGYAAGYNALGDGNVFIGYEAGQYEIGSNSFYVDNQNRNNTAGDKAGALLYGTFNATPASQTLKINATVSITENLNPTASDDAALGTTALMWSDLFLASGGVINWNNGSVVLSHATGMLDLTYSDQHAGVTFRLTNSFSGSGWASGDIVGTLDFYSSDPSNVGSRAKIACVSEGGGTSPYYGSLVFYTSPDGGGTVPERMRIGSAGVITTVNGTNLMVGGATVEAGSTNTIGIANGTAPDAHVDNQVILYSADSSDSTATLGLYLEQAVAVGAYNDSTHKVRIIVNGTQYYLMLHEI